MGLTTLEVNSPVINYLKSILYSKRQKLVCVSICVSVTVSAETSVRQRLPYVRVSLMSLIDSFLLPLMYLSASQYVEILRC